MVFNSSKNPRRRKKRVIRFLSLQLANEYPIHQYSVHFASVMFLVFFFSLVHIIIAVNHSVSSPCQQTLCPFLAFFACCACAFIHWKDKRRWINLRRISKEWAKYRAVSIHLNKGTNQTKYHFERRCLGVTMQCRKRTRNDTESINYAHCALQSNVVRLYLCEPKIKLRNWKDR